MEIIDYFILINASIFIFYGFLCVFAGHMRDEFKRYGLSKFRLLTGYLEILGSLGLLVGFLYPLLTLISSVGLSLLMMGGLYARIKIKDKFIFLLPALFLLIVNSATFLIKVRNF